MNALRRFRRYRVVLHTKDDRSIRGVLSEVHRDCMVITEPEYLAEAAQPLKGRAVIERSNVSWFQVIE